MSTNQRCHNMHILASVEIPQSVSLINCQNTRRNSYYLMDTVRHKLGFEDFLHRAASQRRRLLWLNYGVRSAATLDVTERAEQKDYYLFLSGKTIERCSARSLPSLSQIELWRKIIAFAPDYDDATSARRASLGKPDHDWISQFQWQCRSLDIR